MVVIEISSSPTHLRCYVDFEDERIQTLVTHSVRRVNSWIRNIKHYHRHRLHKLIVGLDIEWRPNDAYNYNRTAILQLCVGRRCLIFQFLYAPEIPDSLIDFLGNPQYTFVGVRIQEDVQRLQRDHDLTVMNTVDLSALAGQVFERRELRNAGLKRLALEILGWEMEKPKSVARSRWDDDELSDDQSREACGIDQEGGGLKREMKRESGPMGSGYFGSPNCNCCQRRKDLE